MRANTEGRHLLQQRQTSRVGQSHPLSPRPISKSTTWPVANFWFLPNEHVAHLWLPYWILPENTFFINSCLIQYTTHWHCNGRIKYKINGESMTIFTVGDKGRHDEFIVCCWVSQQPHHWHLAPGNSFLWEAVLCTTGCLAASLTSTTKWQQHHLPALTIKNVSRQWQMSPCRRQNCEALVANHWSTGSACPSTGKNCTYMVRISREQHP